jgi:D-alanyl-D-alanine carboxypeptidase
MSINPQITTHRFGVRYARAGRTLAALRMLAAIRALAVVVVLAVTLSTHGGPVSAATALGGGGQVGPGAEQGAVEAPRVQARAVILADESTGQVLFERNASAARAMASTTKVMTALLALERLDEL